MYAYSLSSHTSLSHTMHMVTFLYQNSYDSEQQAKLTFHGCKFVNICRDMELKNNGQFKFSEGGPCLER